jgi:hypothetical protein
MVKKITLIQKKYTNDITVDDSCKNHKVEYIHESQQALINNPGKPKQVVCDIAGVSNSTLTRYMKGLGMKSFYRHYHKINRKRKIRKSIQSNKIRLKQRAKHREATKVVQ